MSIDIYRFIYIITLQMCVFEVDNAPDSTAGGASFSQRVREMSADSFLSCLVSC